MAWLQPPPAGAISPGYYQGQPPQAVYPPAAQMQQQYQQMQHEMMECERQLQLLYQQPQRTPELMQRMEQTQQKFNYLRSRLVQMQQSAAPSNQFMPPSQPHPQPMMQQPMSGTQQPQTAQKYGNSAGPSGPQMSPGLRSMPAGSQQIIGAAEKNETPTSVSVHHGNQVQVNITPEPTGRTLISVYHAGYPAPNTITSTANSNQPPAEFSTFYKDSIPPEPLPPKFNVEAQQQHHLQSSSSRMPPCALPAPIKAEVLKNSSTTINASFVSKASDLDSSIISTSIPTSTTCFSSFSTTATKAVEPLPVIEPPQEEVIKALVEVEPAAPAGLFKDEAEELLGEEHAIEKMGTSEIQPADEVNEGYDPFKKSSSAVPVDPMSSQNDHYAIEEQSVAAKYQEKDIEMNESDKEQQNLSSFDAEETESHQNTLNETVANETNLNVTEGTDNFDDSAPLSQNDDTTTKLATKKSKPSSSSNKVKSKKSATEVAALGAQLEEATEMKFQDVESSPADEEPAMEKKEKPTPKTTVAVAKKKTLTVAPQTSRKRPRKQVAANESDWDDLDDSGDQDFVVSKKKKGSRAPKVVEPKVELPDSMEDLDGFVEKRRSSRKKADKTYGDRGLNFEEDDDEDENSAPHAGGSRQPIDEPVLEEWIVEKIIGTRVVKRMVKKKKALEASVVNGELSHVKSEKDDSMPTMQEIKPINVTGPVAEEENLTSEVQSVSVESIAISNGTSEIAQVETVAPQTSSQSVPVKQEKVEQPEEVVEEKEMEVEELYVKYKGRSYLHCQWKSLEELEVHDKRVVGKYNRHKQKFGDSMYNEDEEYFNEDYLVVDRVLDEVYDEEEKENYAFVKWRSLPYDECTWELFKDVPESKIEQCRRRNDVVDTFKMKERPRPPPSEWTQIPLDVVYKDDNTLRDYQVEGVNWLLFCYFNKQNCILADEMGLGKTVQTITFLEGIYDKGIHGPFLIVVPLSTLHNWEREFETWTDMNAVVYHGSAASRQIIQDYEMYYAKHKPDGKKKHIIYKFDALITTFEMVVSDCEVLRKINYRVCVIDEAHRLKNRNCKLLTGGLLSFRMEHRVLLTGTPLQNNIQELFSLLNFLEPEQFCSSDTFLEQFGQCQTEEQVQKLQDILKPMMLRRLKEDVEKTLQPKEETIIEVQLSNIQKKYYRAILEKNFTHLLKGSSQPSLMNTMMELRKCCNHPFLINGAEEQILSEMKLMHPEKSDEELLLHGLIQSSGKMVLTDKLLPKLRQDGHKVLIFSQMVRVLDILEEFLHNMNYPFERIDGNVRGDMRQAAIDRFCKPDSERFVFLLCTRAGGLGINLTAADTVIIFDSDWNPQNDLQAQARCHRIGQTKMVKVYRLITTNTYEREMFDKASLKLGLDKAVLQSSSLGKDNCSQQLTRKEVEDLLRKGAYGAVMEEEETEGSKFSEEDIDTILQRRTQTIKLEPGIKGSTFAKASFKSSTNREDIDVNDPNFWAKWAKKANIDVDAAIGAQTEHLIMAHPRSRRKRFEENQYKASESGEEVDGSSDTEGGSNTGKPANSVSSRILEAKNRSGKKRRRTGFTEEDEDYINYTPNELAFNKSEFFKVEKLLGVWGWGRWKTIKDKADIGLSENDMEHISRTFLLHCIREFKGDEKTRDFVWRLIIPRGAIVGKTAKKTTSISGGIYHEGWAALPEYNPPAFAVDLSFQRHIHRHANKLLQRICHIQFLHKHVIGEKAAEVIEQDGSISEVKLELPMIGDPPVANWDLHCDKSFLIGIFKHGMENYEAIRADSKLCFIEKKIEEMPSNLELNSRFKRLIMVLQRQTELSAVKVSKWPKQEEVEFMRILRTYGVKDDSNSANVINWARFRELSSCLQKKSDAEMLEQLYCVLAMCTKQQGGDLSSVDHKRAECVEAISGKRAEKLMNRLHLMRKIHAIITTGIHNVRTSLKLCATDVMPKGWAETHDEHLLIVVDRYGLDDIVPRLAQAAPFDKMSGLEEKILLRRVVEICTTLETGKWNGVASIEMIEDEEEPGSNKKAATISSRSSSGRSTPISSGRRANNVTNTTSNRSRVSMLSSRKGKNTSSSSPADKGTGTATAQITTGGHLDLGEMEKEKMRNLMHHSFLQKMEQAATTMNPNYMLSLLGLGGTSPSTSKSGQQSSASSTNQSMQQLQQMQALLAMSSLSGIPISALASVSIPRKSSNEDALNLSKRSNTSSKTSTPKASSSGASLSSGLSHSAMKQLSQLSISDLLAMSNFGQETHIPVAHLETGARLSGDKAPKLKNLDQWLAGHPKYSIDVGALAILQPNTSLSSSISASTSGLKTPKEAPKSASPIAKSSTPTPKPSSSTQKTIQPKTSTTLEPGEIPKSGIKTAAETSTSSLENTVLVGVFHKSTGIALPTDKWPTLANLPTWLDKNKECNVQNTYASIVKSLLPKSYHDRLGGDYIAPTVSTPSSSTAASLSQSTSSAAAMTAALTQMLANPLGTSTSSGLLNPLMSTSTGNSNSMSLQNMEALQMQMLLQQVMLGPSLMGQGAAGYNPYAALMGGTSSASNALTEQALAAALMGMTDTGGLTAGLPSAKAASSSNANASMTTNSQTNTPSSSSMNNNNNMAASLLAAVANEAALTAEIMANPTLLATMSMLSNPMTAMSQSQPFGNLSGLDASSTAQLNAALAALGAGTSLCTPTEAIQPNTSSGRSSAAQPPASGTSSSKKSTSNKGRLNAVLEKLSSGNNPSPNPT